MKKFYCILPIILITFLTHICIAQIDTEFWFAPPDVSNLHNHSDNYIEIRLASVSDIPVMVTMSQPANPASPINNLSININPGASYTFNLSSALGTNYKDFLETVEGGIKNTGLLIKSTGLITAYYEVGRATSIPNNKVDTADFNGEIFSLKGANALGRHFFTPFQTYFENIYGGNSSIDIVATEDQTDVTFKLTKNGKNGTTPHNAGVNYTIRLNKGQTYSIVAATTTGAGHMYASEITSTKPIAVTQKDDSIKSWWDNYAADIVGDQLVPVNVVGKEYLVPRGFLQNAQGTLQKNTVFIVPVEPNTTVRYGNGTVLQPQGDGVFLLDISTNNPNSLYVEKITSDKPIYVYYVSGYGAEMGGPLLPPINCTGSQKLSFVRSSIDPFFLTVLVRSDGISNFLVEGQTGVLNAGDFTDVGSGWSVAQKRMDGNSLPAGIPVNQGISIENTKSYFHLGIINGQVTNGTSRFGYFSNYNKISSQLPTTQGLCPGSLVLLDPKVLGVDSAKTQWYLLPDLANAVHIGPRYNALVAGDYVVNLQDKNQCIYIDTVTVKLNSTNPFDLGKKADTVCFNVSSPIKVNGTWNKVLWSKLPPGVNVPDNTTSWEPKKSGLYEVTVSDNSNCVQKDEVAVTYSDSTSKFDLGTDKSTVCFNAKNPIVVKGGPFTKILWSGPEAVAEGTLSFDPTKSGLYTVTVVDHVGCSNFDKVQVNFDTSLANFNLGDPIRNVCSDSPPIVISGGPYASVTWIAPTPLNIPNNTLSYKPTKDGLYKVTVTDNENCLAIDEVTVVYIDTIKPDLGGDSSTSCGTKRIVLKPIEGDFGYHWTTTTGENIPDGTASVIPTKTGLYKVKVFNKSYPQCFGQDSTYITYSPDINLDFTGDSAVSCFNAGFKLCAGSGYSKYDWLPSNVVAAGTKECYSPTKSGKYSLTITDKFNCRKTDSIFVRYYGKIDLGLHGGDTASCFPYQNYVVRVPSGYSKYEWTPDVSKDSLFTPVYSKNLIEKYKVKITNKDGCFDSDSIQVSFVPEIKFPGIPGGDTTACDYAKYTIHAGPGFARYEWVNNVAGPKDSLYVPKSSGKYWVTVYTSRGGCKATSATTNVNFAPDRVIDLGSEITYCKNTPPDSLHAGAGFDRYMWENNPNNNKESFLPKFPPIANGGLIDTIHVQVVYEKSCVASGSKIINFIKNDTLTLGSADTTVCPGQFITISAGEGFLGYSWISSEDPDSVFSEASSVTVTRPGTYSVFVSSTCITAPAYKTILNYENPDATIKFVVSADQNSELTSDTLNFCYTDYATLSVKSGYKKYWWRETISETIFDSINTLRINEDGHYQVKVMDEHNCIAMDEVVAMSNDSCFLIPNLVTPNNDNANDAFKIAGIRLNTWNLEIYNRWGERVYFSKGYRNDWNAEGVADGVYYYHLINPSDERKYKGWVQVIDKR